MATRTPRLTPRILRVLMVCYNAAEAGGFSGDTDGLGCGDTEATGQWLDAWQAKYSKQLSKIEEYEDDGEDD